MRTPRAGLPGKALAYRRPAAGVQAVAVHQHDGDERVDGSVHPHRQGHTVVGGDGHPARIRSRHRGLPAVDLPGMSSMPEPRVTAATES